MSTLWPNHFSNVTGWTTTGSSTTSTNTATFTGGGTSTISTMNVSGTAVQIYTDSSSYDQRMIRDRAANNGFKLSDFGGLLKLANGAGKIILPNGSEIILDDYGNYKISDKNETRFLVHNRLKSGQRLLMPDGAVIKMGHAGKYIIEDQDAKVIYKGNEQREFNKYVNASELLGDFVGALGNVGVTQDKVLKTPIEYFINWLIHRAAEQDEDEHAAKDVPTLIESKPALVAKKPKCKCCGKFISDRRAKAGINFCNAEHMAKYELKIGL